MTLDLALEHLPHQVLLGWARATLVDKGLEVLVDASGGLVADPHDGIGVVAGDALPVAGAQDAVLQLEQDVRVRERQAHERQEDLGWERHAELLVEHALPPRLEAIDVLVDQPRDGRTPRVYRPRRG